MDEDHPPQKRETHWPELTIDGGVHGRNTVVRIDGQRLERVTRAKVVFDVNDAVRLTTYQLVEASVKAEIVPGGHTKVWTANVERVWTEDSEQPDAVTGKPWQRMERELIATSTADTDWQALYDCARQLELAARKDGQGVAQAGTIVEPEGRPPGR